MPQPVYATFNIVDVANNALDASSNIDFDALSPFLANAAAVPSHYPSFPLSSCKTEENDMDFDGDRDDLVPNNRSNNTGHALTATNAYGFLEFWENVSIILLGRKMYETILRTHDNKWPYPPSPKRRIIVFSSTPLPVTVTNMENFPGSLVDLVDALNREGKRSRAFQRPLVWVMGGPRLINAIWDMGLLERVEIVMLPIVIATQGNKTVRLWQQQHSRELTLIESRSCENGTVCFSYNVA